MMKRTFFLAVILLAFEMILPPDSFAGSPHRRGTAAAPELLIPMSAAGIGISGSGLATVRGLDAIHWNPAGLADGNFKAEAMFSHMSYIADIGVDYMAIAGSFGNLGSIGASLQTLSMGDIDVTTIDQPEGTGFSYSPTYILFGLTYSRTMTERVLFGTTAKMIYEKIHLVDASAIAFDFGLQYKAGESGVQFGITLKNLGSEMRFDGSGLEKRLVDPDQPTGSSPQVYRLRAAAYDLPTLLEGGLGYNLSLGETNHLSFNGTFTNNNYSNDEYRFGVEYNYNEMFFLRAGHTLVPDLPEEFEYIYGPTLGFGFHYRLTDLFFAFDYTYRDTKYFDNNQWFTVRLGF